MINARLLTNIKTALADYLTDRCLIEAETATLNALGHPDTASGWTLVAQDVHCRVIRMGRGIAGTAEMANKEERVPRLYRLIVPVGTGLAVDQRVTIDTVEYVVTALDTMRTSATDEQAIIKETVQV